MSIGGIIALCVGGAVLVFGILPMIVMPYFLFRALLVRTDEEKWGRNCAYPDDVEYKALYDEGIAWNEKYKDKSVEETIKPDGYKLVGEYFDFGSDKAVIIIAGRSESLLYSYYFAEPYRVAGYNVLVIDNRAHGLSEGRHTALGFKEYRDLLGWCKLLHDKYNNDSIVLHGICIGCNVALNTCISGAPEAKYIKAMVAEGMFQTFNDTFKRNMETRGHSHFPLGVIAMCYESIFAGCSVFTNGPKYTIDKLDKPILFLHGKEDQHSLPYKAEELYDKCKAPKKIVWFDKGAHSRLRPNAKEKYDQSIIDFLATL